MQTILTTKAGRKVDTTSFTLAFLQGKITKEQYDETLALLRDDKPNVIWFTDDNGVTKNICPKLPMLESQKQMERAIKDFGTSA